VLLFVLLGLDVIEEHLDALRKASEGTVRHLEAIRESLGAIRVSIEGLWDCPSCAGNGRTSEWDEPSASFRKCEACKGTGQRIYTRDREGL
jgi:DnaJ-class molecular chaperone